MILKAPALFLLALLAVPVAAGDIAYTNFELQARSNLPQNDNGYNLPPGSSFNSITPSINADAQVAFPVGVVPEPGGSHPGVWFGSDGSGALVYEGESGAFIGSRTPLNDTGEIVFEISFSSNNGLYIFDLMAGSAAPVSTFPLAANSYGGTEINASGALGYRAALASGDAYGVTDASGTVAYAADIDANPTSPYTYLYTPAFNDAGQIAGKVATSPDQFSELEIRLFSAPDTSTLVLANKAVNPASPYSEFDNGLDVNANGVIAVVATRASGNARVVLRTDGTNTLEIAAESSTGPILEIEYFAPAINEDGWVAFRAVDETGQAIYLGNGEQLIRVVGEGDVVQTDLGVAQIGQHDDSPIFAGSPAINASGDIAFVAGLHPQGNNQIEWGSGVFVAYAPAALDDVIFANGFEPAAR